MKAAPAVSVSIEAHGATVFCVVLCGVGAFAASSVWAWQSGTMTWLALPVAVAIGSVTSVRRWLRGTASTLAWDGQHWHLGSAGIESSSQAAGGGRLTVAIDLDVWLLLHFQADDSAAAPRSRWLALHRSQQPGRWHALRCAIYSPDPSPSGGKLLARG